MSEPNDPPQMANRPDRVDYEETPDVTEVHASIQREHQEPSANVTPIPMWLTGVCGAVMVWAGTYFGVFHGGLSGKVFNEYESSPNVLFPIPTKGTSGPGAGAAATMSLAEQGKSVYGANCLSCHQGSGLGVPANFPPLVKSEWVIGSEKRLVAIILKGLTGPITIGGQKQTYSGNMMGWETTLTDKKIAGVVSFIRAQWGNNAPEVSEAKVAAARQEFAGRKAQWTEADLLQIPEDATLPDAAGATPAATPTAAAGAPAPAATGTPAKAAPPVGAAPATTAPAPQGGAPLDLQASIGRGKALYMQTCLACHQPTGAGIPGAFPPLAGSEYVGGDARRMVAMLINGVAGPIKVKGMQYNNIMMPVPMQFPVLKDDTKLADVINYVRNSFGNKDAAGVTVEMVSAARKEFGTRTTPWTEAELLNFPAAGAPAAPAPAATPAPAPGAPAASAAPVQN
ncbi:MAG: cytochrome c class [Chthoniobacter sp.]|nr:cytochrome c class [Chthoniobacter sp.]